MELLFAFFFSFSLRHSPVRTLKVCLLMCGHRSQKPPNFLFTKVVFLNEPQLQAFWSQTFSLSHRVEKSNIISLLLEGSDVKENGKNSKQSWKIIDFHRWARYVCFLTLLRACILVFHSHPRTQRIVNSHHSRGKCLSMEKQGRIFWRSKDCNILRPLAWISICCFQIDVCFFWEPNEIKLIKGVGSRNINSHSWM